MFRTRQTVDRAKFRRHRDPCVGFRDDGWLAGNGIAHHGKTVCGSNRESIEAIKIPECAFDRLIDAVPFTHAPRKIACGHFGIVLGLKGLPLLAQGLAQPIMVRQRSVMNEAGIGPGREWVRAFGRHSTFGRHASVGYGVRTSTRLQPQTLGHCIRISDPLAKLHRATNAEDRNIRRVVHQPVTGRLPVTIGEESRVIRQGFNLDICRQGLLQTGSVTRPIRLTSRGERRDTVPSIPAAIDREPRGVRSTRRHLVQH